MGCMTSTITKQTSIFMPLQHNDHQKHLHPSHAQSVNSRKNHKAASSASFRSQRGSQTTHMPHSASTTKRSRRNSPYAIPSTKVHVLRGVEEEQRVQPSMNEVKIISPVGSPIPSILRRHNSDTYQPWRANVTHVVIIDDDYSSQEVLVKWLMEKDYSVTVFNDGYEFATFVIEALDIFSSSSISVSTDVVRLEDIDIVLADAMITMPDGMPVLDFLRQNDLTSTIPIVLMSGDLSVQAQERVIRRGADDFLLKPLTKNIVVSTVRAICETAFNRRNISSLAVKSARLKNQLASNHLTESCDLNQTDVVSSTASSSSVDLLKPHILIIMESCDEFELLYSWLLHLQPIVFHAHSCDDAWKAIDSGSILVSANNISVLPVDAMASVNVKRVQLDLCIVDCKLLRTFGSVLIDRLNYHHRSAVPLLLICNETVPNSQLLEMTKRELVLLLCRMQLSCDIFVRKTSILLYAVRNRRAALDMLHTIGCYRLALEHQHPWSTDHQFSYLTDKSNRRMPAGVSTHGTAILHAPPTLRARRASSFAISHKSIGSMALQDELKENTASIKSLPFPQIVRWTSDPL